jgi:hypothetical protein
MKKALFAAMCAAILAAPAVGQPEIQMVPGSDYEVAAGADRVSFNVSKNQRGTTVPVPVAVVSRLCGDQDGCSVRIGMHNWDDTGRVASREFLFFYNRQNRAWRASAGDPSGTDSNNTVQHVNNSWACYLTDGEYANWNGTDSAAGFGLLSWNQYNADCWLTLID